MKKLLLTSSRLKKQLIVAISDFILICLSTIFSILISAIDIFSLQLDDLLRFLWFPSLTLIVFYFAGVYKSILRFIDFSSIYLLFKALLISSGLFLLLRSFILSMPGSLTINFLVSRDSLISYEAWIIGLLSCILLITGSRIIAYFYFNQSDPGKKVIIYGAGDAGIQLAGALRVSSEMEPIAFIDRDNSLHDTFLGGMKVFHPDKLHKLIRKNKVDEVLIAIPSASKSILKELLKEIQEFSVKVRILPGLAELAQGKVLVSELKEVDITDLLGRYEVEANQELIDRDIRNKSVLITGAGGSIGSEIARQVSKNNPRTLIILDSNEFALYEIKNEIESSSNKINLRTIIGSVTNKRRIKEVCETFSVDTIYHTAAYKHVSLVEENTFEGAFNNIIGTKICVEAAIESKVGTFVLISSDKAVRPTNIMGATKRFSEMVLQSFSHDKDKENITRMTMVRFGNVLGSSGSAVPLFQKQIKEGGPVTVTDPDVTRYFMSIPEAAELVIQAGAMGEGGDVFVLDMGEPVKILDLAKRLINLSGLELKDQNNPDGDIEIIFTGLRPGEKLYEELLIGDNISVTEHKQILRAEEDYLSLNELNEHFKLLHEAEKEGDVKALRDVMRKVVSGFTPEEEIVDVVYLQKINNI